MTSTDPEFTGALVSAAKKYQSRGWRVIQLHSVGGELKVCSCEKGANCRSAGKHPLDKKWEQSPEPDIDAAWERRPKSNVGIATGEPSGIWVLDLDPDHDGVDNFGGLISEHGGEFPETYAVQTGRGGFHYYFTWDPSYDFKNSVGKLAEGVDIRTTGGQVVAAPSRTDYGAYRVVRDVDPVPAPQWLLDLLKPTSEPQEAVTAEELPKPEDIEPAEWDRLTKYAQSAVDRELSRLDDLDPKVWESKGRKPWNVTTFEVACSLAEIANSPWNAYSIGHAQRDVYTRSPRDDGFTDGDVEKIWKSARERIGDKARAVPVNRARDDDYDLFGESESSGKGHSSPGSEVRQNPEHSDDPWRFFRDAKKDNLDVDRLRDEIIWEGPVGWGADQDFWSYGDGVWRSDRQVVKRRMVGMLGWLYRATMYNSVRDKVRFAATEIPGDPIPQWMNFRNGMLDWQTGNLVEHDPAYLSTIQFPLDYNKDATCPNFDRFLEMVLLPDYIKLIWEVIGYLMYSGNPQQIAVMLFGVGQNGKGTLIRIIQALLGVENIANESLDQLNQSTFSSVNLFGKIANIAGDIDATYQESTANFKKLTGEDMIGAERKFGDRFRFENWAVPLFSANEIPGSSDVSPGYLRRWVVIHFHRRFSNEDRVLGLSDLLATELDGIAAKAVRALQDLMRRGQFDISGEAQKGQDEFAQKIDQVREWIAKGGPSQAPNHRHPLHELYAEYVIWANHIHHKTVLEQTFSKRLEAAGYPIHDVDGIIYHEGLYVSADQRVTPKGLF